MLALLSLERKQNNSSNPIRIPKFLFLSYSFGIETTNTFIHFRKCPRRKPYPFSDQNSAKTLPDGVAHTCILAYIGEYPPGLEGWRFEMEDNMHLSFQISCRFFKDVLLKILFLNFQHPLFFRDPFMSLLKLRTFGYTSPHGAGCSNPKNIGWMNNICNSLHVVSVFPFLFWGKRFLVCAKQCGRKNSFLDFSCA